MFQSTLEPRASTTTPIPHPPSATDAICPHPALALDIRTYHTSSGNNLYTSSRPQSSYLPLSLLSLLLLSHPSPPAVSYGRRRPLLQPPSPRRRSRAVPARAVVLRDAGVHALVDDGDGRDLHPGAVPRHHALPAVLLVSGRICQESGTYALHTERAILAPLPLPLFPSHDS